MIRHLVYILPFFSFGLLIKGQVGEDPGAIIVLSEEGSYEVRDADGNLLTKNLKPGSVLRDGLIIKTGPKSEISVLFSNGLTASILSNSSLRISSFKQNSFDPGDQKLGELNSEPSLSSTDLSLEFGDLVVQTKKLNRRSSFNITSPIGTAGIRGTEFQLSQSVNGQCKLDVATSTVSFTNLQGVTSTVSNGQGLDIAPAGGMSERKINVQARINIIIKNTANAKIAAQITLNVIKEAVSKAAKLLVINIPKTNDNEEEEDSEDEEKDLRNAFMDSHFLNKRTVLGVETVRLSHASSVSYSYDADSKEIIIHFYDHQGNLIDSVRISVFNFDLQLLLETLKPWQTEHDKIIDALALQVFMEQLGLGYSYDEGINDALQSAIGFARIFLSEINLNYSLPSANTWKASDLVYEFTQNPYAYEFGLLLVKFGALGEANFNSDNQSISSLGTEIIELLGGRKKLSNLDYLNKISSGKIKPGDVINGQPVNGSILGTRSFSVDSGNNLDDLSLEIDRLTAIVGSEVTFENNAELDVSTLDSTGENQVVAFAAAKDLVIKGNLTFKNSKNSKQAISIGAADDVHFRSKSITDYFDNEFAQKYLNEIDDPIFLGSNPIKPAFSPSPLKITNEGKDMGIGSSDIMELVDVDVSTNGYLAIGSLSELKILSTRFDESVEFSENNIETVLQLNELSAGTSQESGKIYMYAHDRIAVNGLGFGGNVREIYMDANTIDLKNIKFPGSSEVMLKSKLGYPTFGHENRKIGHVNFIKNVYHGADSVNQGFFHSDQRTSRKSLGSSPAIKIRSNN